MRCFAAKAAKPASRYFIGIAVDAQEGGGGSEDFCLVDTDQWDEEALTQARNLQADLGYFMSGRMRETAIHVDEYPDTGST
jgi:hypothetical protein